MCLRARCDHSALTSSLRPFAPYYIFTLASGSGSQSRPGADFPMA